MSPKVKSTDPDPQPDIPAAGAASQEVTSQAQVPGAAEASPVRPYRTIVLDSGGTYTNRVCIGTAATGLVRMEWVQARYGQIIPMNWSQVQVLQWMDSYIPLRYQVADAQNLIVRHAIEYDFEWLLLIEHDVILPADAMIRLNQYIREEEIPVISGLYYSRSHPSEPLVFRGRGTSVYTDWQPGDLVWADGVPTGILLIHMGLIRAMWEESPEYIISTRAGETQKTRRVFHTPRILFVEQTTGRISTSEGTSDLEWCSRIIDGGYFTKAGWPQYQEKRYPFLVDTNIFCKHINPDGEQFP